MIHFEALTSEARELFPLLSAFKKDFYLAGGTALALQLGHRISVDFDLFSPDPIKKNLLGKVEALYALRTIEVFINNSRELTLTVSGVKHTFLHYPFPVLLPISEHEPVDTLSPQEILATKAYTIGRRGSQKDYVDLYTGVSEHVSTLADVIQSARTKYGDAFNDRLFLEQLLYLDDVPQAAMQMLKGAAPTREELVDFFQRQIAGLLL
ncbi:MAG: nucleotidyl transferase AbiEii/AbiGii toxin family protein [Minisyncoccia bacterium]